MGEKHSGRRGLPGTEVHWEGLCAIDAAPNPCHNTLVLQHTSAKRKQQPSLLCITGSLTKRN